MSVEEADGLYDKIPTVQEMEDFIDKHQDTKDADLIWRLARFAAILIKTHPDLAKRKSYSVKIKELGEKGLELNPESAGCNKFYSIGLMEGPGGQSDKAKNIHIVKKHFQKAAEIDPQDPYAQYLLGVWHFRVADMPWLLKKIVNAVLSNPPNATYDEAFHFFKQADELKPNGSLRNSMMYGKTCLRLKDYGKAKEYLQKAVDFEPKRPEDEEFLKEAKDLLKGL
ncbi:regulator of microtubule dynamics protein 1 isoform X2 [Exaiptasia diaphana]|nr:regulator of microtubule dynamics protein 1 isoform X2 [Exaiptasia diaphana]KXJ23809.1 Regulator of microtubule dynamics protein 1 [Exaiptasia diaphana]